MSESPSTDETPTRGVDAGSDPSPRQAKKTQPAPVEVDEKRVSAPSTTTLVILGSLCTATLIMWAAGRAACNYHVPGESLTPRAVSVAERTAGPKDLGFEFSRALRTGDFETARALSIGEARALVDREAAACPSGCSERTELQGSVQAVAELLAMNLEDAYVKTRVILPSGQADEQLLEIERQDQGYRVTRVLPASSAVPALKPAPTPHEAAPDVPPSLRLDPSTIPAPQPASPQP